MTKPYTYQLKGVNDPVWFAMLALFKISDNYQPGKMTEYVVNTYGCKLLRHGGPAGWPIIGLVFASEADYLVFLLKL